MSCSSLHDYRGGINPMVSLRRNCFTILLLALCLLPVYWVHAEGDSDNGLAVHGFLTQAYAATDGNQIFGIPDEGTTDYRKAALQFRYTLNDKNDFVIQFSHERQGKSVFINPDLDLQVDWAFYQRHFTDKTWVRVGKVQMPFGIYNELRDVGTVLPFYRLPFGVYGENSFSSETVDGIVGYHRFSGSSPWSADLNVFYGGSDYFETDHINFGKARSENGLGYQLWINTPVSGLRFGVHQNRQTIRGGLFRPPGQASENFNKVLVSGEGVFQRFALRSEYEYNKFELGHSTAYYIQAEVNVIAKLTIMAQSDHTHVVTTGFFGELNFDYDKDYAVGARYAFLANLILKAEVHWDEGIGTEVPPGGLVIGPKKTTYGILSLSYSF